MIPFRETWFCDFEFALGLDHGERPYPVCMVAREMRTGRELRLWRNRLVRLRRAPFPAAADTLFVSYYAMAELSCFLELGWPLPRNIIDFLPSFAR